MYVRARSSPAHPVTPRRAVPSVPGGRQVVWHTRSVEAVVAALDTDAQSGLTEAEAARRLAADRHRMMEEFLRQFLAEWEGLA